MTHATQKVIAEAVQRDDHAMLDDLKSLLVLDQNAFMSQRLQTQRVMRDVRIINACRPADLSSERRQTLLSLAAIVGKFEVLTAAFNSPLVPDNELLLELLDPAHLTDLHKRGLQAIVHLAFRAGQIHAARVLTSWLIEHADISDIDLCEIFESTIQDGSGDEWVFEKMLKMGYLQSVLRKAKKGVAFVTPELLGQLNMQSDDIKIPVIKRVLGRRRA